MSQGDSHTVPARLPDDLAASVERVAHLKGTTPGTLIAAAWAAYMRRNGERIRNELHAIVDELQ